MAINPIVYTEKIVRSFLKYQLTACCLPKPSLPVRPVCLQVIVLPDALQIAQQLA